MTAMEKSDSGTMEICEPMAVSVEKCESMTEEDTRGSRKTETEETDTDTRKRIMEKELQPVLTRLPSEEPSCGSNCIRINKDQFRIGRKPDNDEVILSVWISRNHCVLHRDKNSDNWFVTNLSSTDTLLNGAHIPRNSTSIIQAGDVLQLSLSDCFKYTFSYVKKDRECIKYPKLEENKCELGNVLDKQRSFVAFQESERKDLEKQLLDKQLEQEKLKEELEKLLQDQKFTKTCNNDLNNQIAELQKKIEVGNSTELELQQKYRDLLGKLEEERLKFEEKLAQEKQKWQQVLKETKQEKEKLEMSMVEQMEELREKLEKKQQEEWQKKIDNLLLEEKNVQLKLQNEKQLLEHKLKQMEEELKQKEEQAKLEQQLQLQQQEEQRLQLAQQQEQIQQQQAMITQPIDIQHCIIVEIPSSNKFNLNNQLPIMETIDLTSDAESTSSSFKNCQDEAVIDKVNNIMDEQLTCSICSELFVRAMTLNCTHTFCRHCIDLWIERKPPNERQNCPTCRTKIVSMTRSLVVDNFIEKMLESLTPEEMQKRKNLIQERRIYTARHPKKGVCTKRK
ncbi:hypothetical protein TSAR_014845 [Trichomalopsis sarcophagae]|uniref:E3 ubiquitin-protein ligase CHFR n=1 Tax=Trichomalopsis sarcophagae TaxID=543379 RepID=A0A232FLM8_9HYME|nr:hypothetical protein TSAR_014845 [Trichomalopsis sarcophagae]